MGTSSFAYSRDELIERITGRVHSEWTHTLDTLVDLARIPSVSWPSFDQSRVAQSAEFVERALTELEIFDTVVTVREPMDDGNLGQPAIIARREPRNGAATVLLYAHHDVQPAGDLDEWKSAPFEPEMRGDRYFGRGIADDKAGVVMHIESLRHLTEISSQVDLGIVVFIEGEEEYGSPSFTSTLTAHKELLKADVIIVADSTNWTTEIPALTVSLRGNATVKVTVRTLDHALHSGMFGGAVPDAMLAMTRLLASLHTDQGDVAVSGLSLRSGETPAYPETTLRVESGLLEGVDAIGDGDFLSRLWNRPAITVIGIDAPPTSEASNTLLPTVSAMLSLRVAPGQDAAEAAAALVAHLESHAPFGARVTCVIMGTGAAFEMDSNHPVVETMKNAMRDAWNSEPVDMGVGGSIPFIAEFVDAFPAAVVLVTGVEDPDSRAHSPNESLHLPSYAKAVVAQTVFLATTNSSV